MHQELHPRAEPSVTTADLAWTGRVRARVAMRLAVQGATPIGCIVTPALGQIPERSGA